MYPGVAEYADRGTKPFRVFLNENTIRSMGPSFAGKPVYVMHVDEVHHDIDELRKEVDGWVIESFYNEADGKHWVKFLVCSKKGEQAIQKGYKLSNCYLPGQFGLGGVWNGVSYDKEVKSGGYEHLAIVPNPRYEESIIMTPEQFKAYNDDKRLELQRLSNNKDEREPMKLKLFERKKVENSTDLEKLCVALPKSGKEMTISEMATALDEIETGKPRLVNSTDLVMFNGKEITVDELAKLANAKKKNEDDDDDKMENEEEEDDEDKMENEEEEIEEEKEIENEDDDDDDEYMENEDDDDELCNEDEDQVEEDKKAMKRAKDIVDHEKDEIAKAKKNKKHKNDLAKAKAAAKRAAREKADRLRNAHQKEVYETPVFDPTSGVEKGRARYGS